MPASATLVTPTELNCLPARISASLICSVVGSEIFDLTKSCAASRRTPVGSPCSSRSIVPPSGSGVFRVTPASLQCAAIDRGDVAAGANHHHWVVRSDRVKILAIRMPLLGQARLVVAARR